MNSFEKLENVGFVEIKMLPPFWWVNSDSGIAFEFGAVEDADPGWLDQCINQRSSEGDFVFYFAYGTPMSEQVCAEVLARIGRPELRIDMRRIRALQP